MKETVPVVLVTVMILVITAELSIHPPVNLAVILTIETKTVVARIDILIAKIANESMVVITKAIVGNESEIEIETENENEIGIEVEIGTVIAIVTGIEIAIVIGKEIVVEIGIGRAEIVIDSAGIKAEGVKTIAVMDGTVIPVVTQTI